MDVLVINCGSSSLKFDLVELGDAAAIGHSRKAAHGLVDRIGHDATVDFQAPGVSEKRKASVQDHKEAVSEVFAWLNKLPGRAKAAIDAVGHRVVHGGDRFVSPTPVDDSVLQALDGLSELAPLHNPAAIQGIRAARAVLGTSVPMVAVFDTAFHNTLPPHAAAYALPRDLAQRYKIRRYGFHGVAHEYMLRRYSEITGVPTAGATLITLQLGNGCSATAIRDGRSVDTSMGFTPLEGLVMGTRSGDLDPGIIAYLARKEQIDASEVEAILNERSGLLGVSALSSDMRDLLAAISQKAEPGGQKVEDAELPFGPRLAVDLFCYRARKYIGAYLAALEGRTQAVVFGGGIGEHSPDIRSRICSGMEWCGLRLDPERNARAKGAEERISAGDSAIEVYVVPVDEAELIARYTAEAVAPGKEAQTQ
jgi:acetate kinase